MEILLSQKNKEKLLNVVNDHGNTPLHYACFWRHADICIALISHGAPIGPVNKYGKVPLQFAGSTLQTRIRSYAEKNGLSTTTIVASTQALRSVDQVETDAKAKRIAQVRKQFWDMGSTSIVCGDLLFKMEKCDVFYGKCLGKLSIIKKYAVRGTPVTHDMVTKFKSDIEPLQLIAHECLLAVSGACFEVSNLAIVFESESTQTLQDILHDASVELQILDVIVMALDVCQAMQYLYANGSSHLSLKSQNVIVTTENRVKLMDYGLYNTPVGLLSDNTEKIFEPHWMPPEVLVSGKVTDAQSTDVYSFGILLCELVTRLYPFADTNHMTVGLRVALEGWRPDVPDYVPIHIKRLMELCWHEEPESRPSFTDVVTVLEKIMQSDIVV